MIASLTSYLNEYGYVVLFVIVFLESTGLPLPGESLIIGASILAGQGHLHIGYILGFAWVGAVLGDNLGYWIGHSLGQKLVVRYGSKIGLTEERFGRVEAQFHRYGPALVLVARFFLVLRQLNGFAAGTLKMHWWLFFLFNAIGAALWVGGWGLGAYVFGSQFEKFFQGSGIWALAIAGGAIAIIGTFSSVRFMLKKHHHSHDHASDNVAKQSSEASQPGS